MRTILTTSVMVCAVLWAAQFSFTWIFATASIGCALAALADWRSSRVHTPIMRNHEPPPDEISAAEIFQNVADKLRREQQ